MSDIENQSLSVAQEVNLITISNDEDNKRAVLIGKRIKDMQKQVEDSYNPFIEKAHQAHKEAIAQRDKFLKPLKDAEVKAVSAIKKYLDEQERKRLEMQEKLRLEAEKEAEDKRKALLDTAKDDFDKEELEIESKNIVANVQVIEKTKTEGLSQAKRWKYRVTDINKLPKEYLVITENSKALQALADSTKGTLKIDGVEFYPETQVRL